MSLRKQRSLNCPYCPLTMLSPCPSSCLSSTLSLLLEAKSLHTRIWPNAFLLHFISSLAPSPLFITHSSFSPLTLKSSLVPSSFIQVLPNSCLYFLPPNFSSAHFSPHCPEIGFGQCYGLNWVPPNPYVEFLTLIASACDEGTEETKL